jgi:MFS family permease
LIVANTPPLRMGIALSLAQGGSLVGQTLGPAFGAFLAAVITHHHWMYAVSGGILFFAGFLVAVFVREVKQLASGRWRLQWIGPLRQLVAVPRIGPLFLLGFLFAVLWAGNVTVMSLYVMQLVAAQGSGAEAYWVGVVALALAVSGVVAMPFWGRALDRHDPARVLGFTTAAAALTQVPLLFLQTPLELAIARALFGLTAGAMQPAIVRLIKEHAPAGMDARAISYATSFQFIAMGLAPFSAGIIAPAVGLRAYFALTIVLTVAGLLFWLRSRSRS